MATRRWWLRAAACVAMVAVLIFGWHRVQPPWWDTVGDVAEMLDNQQTGVGYDGIDEYVPSGADVYEIKNDARRVSFEGDGTSRIRISEWGPESKMFSAILSRPGRLVLKLFSYPAWKVEVNGRSVQPEALDVTAQIAIPVEAGENYVRVTLARTRDRKIGGIISFATLILILGGIVSRRHTAFLSGRLSEL